MATVVVANLKYIDYKIVDRNSVVFFYFKL